MLREILKKSRARNTYPQGENGVPMWDMLAESAENTVECLSRTSRQHPMPPIRHKVPQTADMSKLMTLSPF